MPSTVSVVVLLLLSLSVNFIQCFSFVPKDAPDDYVDDVNHCLDPSNKDGNLIDCDKDTWMWIMDQITAAPPAACVEEWDGQDDLLALQEQIMLDKPDDAALSEEEAREKDRFEPCVLWAMKYVLTAPTAAPNATETGTYFT
jgi:hypothetical protein